MRGFGHMTKSRPIRAALFFPQLRPLFPKTPNLCNNVKKEGNYEKICRILPSAVFGGVLYRL
jgi:hypothetical protein